MLKTLLVIGLTAAAPHLAEARTVTVSGIVTLSSGLVEDPEGGVIADYPAVGSIGSLTYTIGENDLGEVDPTTSFLLGALFAPRPVTATATVGSFQGGMIPTAPKGETELESVFSTTGVTGFSTRSIGQGISGETFAGGLRFTYSPALASAPATWGDLFAAIDSGDARASLSWNGTLQGRFIQFAITQTEPAPVPLPGTAPLMAAGLAGLAMLRRSRRGVGRRSA